MPKGTPISAAKKTSLVFAKAIKDLTKKADSDLSSEEDTFTSDYSPMPTVLQKIFGYKERPMLGSSAWGEPLRIFQ